MGASSSLLQLLSHAARMVRRFPGGTRLIDGGALVFALHRVAAIDPGGLHSNESLKVTPGYLESLVHRLRAEGYRFVSLDDLVRAAASGGRVEGMLCLTFDDGYQDNLENALPLCERLKVPFLVYVPTAMADGTAFLWWFALGKFLLDRPYVQFSDGRRLPCRTNRERERAFMEIRGTLLTSGEGDPRDFLLESICDFESALVHGAAGRYAMDWEGVRRLAKSPVATVGCHTMTHANLRLLSEHEVRRELRESKAYLEKTIGREVRHLAFPFGGPEEAGEREYRLAGEVGFATAATMIPGSVGRGRVGVFHRLPRIFVREGIDPEQLIAENRARVWLAGIRGLARP